MLGIIPWAFVAFVSLADATLAESASPNDDSIRCCPCLSSDLGPSGTTVTVTVTSPKETVTVDHTVVMPATTVFVTASVSSNAIIQEATVHPEAPANKETTISAGASASASNSEPVTLVAHTKTITKTIQAGGDQSEAPATVTVTIKPDQSSASGTVNAAETPALAINSTVTVTVGAQDPGAKQSAASSRSTESSRSDSIEGIGANTVAAAATTQQKVSQSTSATAEPSVKTVTFVENSAKPSSTTGTSASASSNPNIKTVTVVENPSAPSTATVVLAATSANAGVKSATVVDNASTPSTAAAASRGGSSDPSDQTVTLINNPHVAATSSSSALRPAITAAPQLGTAASGVSPFTTLTQTVSSSGGNVSIEINIINIFTGDSICIQKDTGEPCDPKHKVHHVKPSGQVPCLTTGVVTSTATAFNTVVVTVSDGGLWSNGTSAAGTGTGVAPPLGTGTGSPMLRRGRLPLIRKRL